MPRFLAFLLAQASPRLIIKRRDKIRASLQDAVAAYEAGRGARSDVDAILECVAAAARTAGAQCFAPRAAAHRAAWRLGPGGGAHLTLVVLAAHRAVGRGVLARRELEGQIADKVAQHNSRGIVSGAAKAGAPSAVAKVRRSRLLRPLRHNTPLRALPLPTL